MAASDIFRRAVQKGLAILGEPSSLAGQPCGRVAVARDVDLFAGSFDRVEDNRVANAVVVTIESQYTPRVGQTLVHPTEGTFKLMRLAADDGFKRQFIVVQT